MKEGMLSYKPQSDSRTWEYMRTLGYIPLASNARAVHNECRNGIRMCASHRMALDSHQFYILWVPQTDGFIVMTKIPMEILLGHQYKVLSLPDCFPVARIPCSWVSSPIVIALSPSRDMLAALALVSKSEDIDADTCVPQDANVMTITPIRLQADSLALWLQALVMVDEDAAWDRTADENYERQVGILV